MEPLWTKILCGALVMSLSVLFGYLPVLISRKFPLLSASDPRHNKKALRNIVFSFLLNFGGGVLFANSFCHWLPEVREAIEAKKLSSKIPLAEVITCSGFFLISFLEELIHHFIHPSDNHKKNKKSKIHSGKVANISQRNEFELYDEKSKMERKKEAATISSIEDPHFTDPEEDKDENKSFLHDEKKAERTKSLLRTAFVVASLSFHSVIAGLTLGLEKETSGVWINFGAIAMHKFVIAFSVGIELVTSRATKAQYLISISIFSLAPAVGTGIGTYLSERKNGKDIDEEEIENDLALQILQAIATGTVIYVIFFEIFPKAKEIGGTGFQHVISMIAGFAIFLPSLLFHSHDEHDHDHDHDDDMTTIMTTIIHTH